MIMKYDESNRMVKIDVRKYIHGCLEEFKEDFLGMEYKSVAAPATEHLF
jgi:hypothetical protein